MPKSFDAPDETIPRAPPGGFHPLSVRLTLPATSETSAPTLGPSAGYKDLYKSYEVKGSSGSLAAKTCSFFGL